MSIAPLTRALLVAGLLATGACSAGQGQGGATTPASAAATRSTATGEPWTRPPCDQGAATAAVEAEPVAGVESDWTVTSVDGTEIRAHWFPSDAAPAGEPAPTVLMGPGWSLPGDTSVDGAELFGALGIGPLNQAGYNVLTWDPRGFGASAGTATVNAPENEGRDVQVLLDWVAGRPEALLDGEGDPRAGMVGFSYGGGIQLTVASIDCRVDAIVPGLAWHSLETSLYKAETVKAGWAGVLTQAATLTGSVDPHVTSAADSSEAEGVLRDEDVEWFVGRGPGDAVDAIEVPTLLVQGTVDTLFTLDEAVTVHRSLTERGVPAAMLWFCGGHGTCLTEPGDTDRVAEATFAWLDHWLAGDGSVDTGPAFETVDQDGTRWMADTYPDEVDVCPTTGPHADQVLRLVAEGGSGPATVPAGSDDPLAGLVAAIIPAPADNAVEVPVEIPADHEGRLALGAPRLRFTYSGTVADGPRPTRLFAQIVDEEAGVVVGSQVTPIAVTLDGAEHTAEVDLEIIAQRLPTEGEAGLVLQIVATTTAYAVPRLGGEVAIGDIELDLPLVGGLTRG